MRIRRVLSTAILMAIAVFASSCGGDGPLEISSEPGGLGDTATKPTVPERYQGDFEELIITDLIVGDGEVVQEGRMLAVHYVGVTAGDGTEFDASWNRGDSPLNFPLGEGQVIKGWDEGVIGMRVGGRRVLQVPSDLAYGESSPTPDIGPNADLIFIVDMVSMAPLPPEIPADALGRFDELGVIDLADGEGVGAVHGDIMSVQYVGVSADDGVEFDSSWSRNATPFVVIAGGSGVIEGWQRGLVGMKVGGERILQIPSDQAYGEGDLVFRVHLEELTPAPFAHTLVFHGAAPADTEVTTLIEGDGVVVEPGSVLSAQVVVMRYRDSMIVQSTYATGDTAVLLLSDNGLLPGLDAGLSGIRIGETRQVVLPADVAFPDGVPAEAGIADDDALVFVVEATSFTEPDAETVADE